MSNFIYYEKLEDYEEQVKKAKLCDEKDKEIERLQHNQEVSTKWEIELTGRISKALEYIKTFCNDKARVRNDISGKDIDKLIKILKGSDKE